MRTTLRIGGAIALVTSVGLLLASPVMFGGRTEITGRVHAPSGSRDASGETTGAPNRSRPRRLDAVIQPHVFCPRLRPRREGLIAVYRSGQVVILDASGTVQARIEGRPPVRWSASGRLLAVGPHGAVWTATGERVGGSETPREITSQGGVWAWSPSGDCALVLRDGHLAARTVKANVAGPGLTQEVVESFAWGRGNRFGLLIKRHRRRSLWFANLRRGSMRQAHAFRSETCCIVLAGWTPNRERLLFWAGSGASVMADGWPLRSVDRNGNVQRWGSTLPRPSVLEKCDGDVVALVGGDRFQENNRVAVLSAQRRPISLSPRGSYSDFACSPDGSFIVLGQNHRIYLIDAQVRAPRPLMANAGRVVFAEWGRSGSGLLFVRDQGRLHQLWHIAEGGTPRLIAALSNGNEWPVEDSFDWTATPPRGIP